MDDYQCCRLDRILINEAWLDLPPFSTAEFPPPEVSDHCLSLLRLGCEENSGSKSFKFFNHWTKREDFLPAVREAWNTRVEGNPTTQLYQRLKILKLSLKKLALKQKTSMHEIQSLQEKLCQLQHMIFTGSVNQSIMKEEGEVRCKLLQLQ